MINLVTGASGFIGQHLVEALLLRGERVHALVRPSSSVHQLDKLGADVRVGILSDQATLMSAAEGVERIWHCAGLVGDWGQPDAFVQANVDGVRNILAVATRVGIKRLVHLSTTDVYGFPGRTTDERGSLAPRGFAYVDTKVEGEKLVMSHYQRVGLPVTIIRPGTVYGPGSAFLAQLADQLLRREAYTIDGGKHRAGLTYISNLIGAMLLAGDAPDSVGQAYNITDGSAVTWREFIEALANALNMPFPERNYRHWYAYALATGLESLYTLRGKLEAPRLTRMGVERMGSEQDYPIAKAQRELGYRPSVGLSEGIRASVAWLRKSGRVELESDVWRKGVEKH
ncbi:MAG: NAD-dependent epimerase/dehydratase family protein [Chloroflexi bacterium]|nr:NAD-dependent epimerase/dehydratase family protein [Chloroflexota bacterium]